MQVHYRESIEPDSELSPLFKDVFLFHAKEESQHAILDELEWVRENAKVTPEARDAAVDDLIALVGAVDGILQAQSAADTHYFVDDLRPAHDGGRGRSREGDRSCRLSLAVHRVGRADSAVRRIAERDDHAGARASASAPRSRRSWPDRPVDERGDPNHGSNMSRRIRRCRAARAGPCDLRPRRARPQWRFSLSPRPALRGRLPPLRRRRARAAARCVHGAFRRRRQSAAHRANPSGRDGPRPRLRRRHGPAAGGSPCRARAATPSAST